MNKKILTEKSLLFISIILFLSMLYSFYIINFGSSSYFMSYVINIINLSFIICIFCFFNKKENIQKIIIKPSTAFLLSIIISYILHPFFLLTKGNLELFKGAEYIADYEKINNINIISVLTFIFLFMFLIGYFIKFKNIKNYMPNIYVKNPIKITFLIVTILSIIGFLSFYFYFKNFGNIFEVIFKIQLIREGKLSHDSNLSFIKNFTVFLELSNLLIISYIITNNLNKLRYKFLILFHSIILIFVLFFLGGRGNIIFYLFKILYIVSLTKKVKINYKIVFIIFIVFLILFMYRPLILSIQNGYFSFDFLKTISTDINIIDSIIGKESVDYDMLILILDSRKVESYYLIYSLFSISFSIIPSKIFPLASNYPPLPHIFTDLLTIRDPIGQTVHMGILGFFYVLLPLSLGILLGGFLLGIFISRFDKIVLRNKNNFIDKVLFSYIVVMIFNFVKSGYLELIIKSNFLIFVILLFLKIINKKNC